MEVAHYDKAPEATSVGFCANASQFWPAHKSRRGAATQHPYIQPLSCPVAKFIKALAWRCLCWRMGPDFFEKALHRLELIGVAIPGDFHDDMAHPCCGIVLYIRNYILGVTLQG